MRRILVGLFLAVPGLGSAQTKSPPGEHRWVAEQFFFAPVWAEKAQYYAGEMKGRYAEAKSMGESGAPARRASLRAIKIAPSEAVYTVQVTAGHHVQDWYAYLTKEGTVWRLVAVRTLALPPLFLVLLDSLEAIESPSDSVGQMLENMRLTVTSDSGLKAFFQSRHAALESIADGFSRETARSIAAAPDGLKAPTRALRSLAPVPEAGFWADLGCGGGADALTVAARHPQPQLRIVGLDASGESILEAVANGTGDSRVASRKHRLSTDLPFERATLDVVYSNNLIECLRDRVAFAREVARVLKPGGWAVMAHWDWDSQLFDATDKPLVRRLVHAFADWQQDWMDSADGWMGRRLWGTFTATGLFEGTLHARVLTNTIYASPWYGHARAQDFRALVKRDLATADDDYERFIAERRP